MTLHYLSRLCVLSLASFFLLHVAFAGLISFATPVALRLAEHLSPRAAARFLLVLRFSGFGLAILLTAVVCVPSYLCYEPQALVEPVGWTCLVAATLCLFIFALSVGRAVRALASSRQYVRACRRIVLSRALPLDCPTALVYESSRPCLFAAGIFQARILISSRVLKELSPEQLATALRHEQAHSASRDNLKRLLLLIAPAALPWVRSFDSIDRAWARFAEWAADDHAISGDARDAVSLAEALVRLSRLATAPTPSPLMTSLLADGHDLAARIERLLQTPTGPQQTTPLVFPVLALASSVLLAFAFLLPRTPALFAAHALLEHLIH